MRYLTGRIIKKGKNILTGWCPLDEFTNVHVVALSRVLMDQVDLILENNDMFQSHQLDSSHVLFRLRLERYSVLIFFSKSDDIIIYLVV